MEQEMINPYMRAHATPVGAYAVYQGIKVEVVAMIWGRGGGVLYYTVEDLEGDRINENTVVFSGVYCYLEWSNPAHFIPNSITRGQTFGAPFDAETGRYLGQIRFAHRPEYDALVFHVTQVDESIPQRIIDTIFEVGGRGIQAVQRRFGFGGTALTAFADSLLELDRSGFFSIVQGNWDSWIIPFELPELDETNAIVLNEIQFGDISASFMVDFFSLRYSATGFARADEFVLELVMQDGSTHTFAHKQIKMYGHPHLDYWWTLLPPEARDGFHPWIFTNNDIQGDAIEKVQMFFETPFDISQIREIRMNGVVIYE